MIALKPGVNVDHVTPGLAWALFRVHGVYERCGYDSMTITSADDYDHGQRGVPDAIDPRTLHGKGRAADIRTRGTSEDFKRSLVDRVRAALTINGLCDFDVLLEGLGAESEHLHIEQERMR